MTVKKSIKKWESKFKDYLRQYKLSEVTIDEHVRMLKCEVVENILHIDHCGLDIDDLAPDSTLYMLQAKVCLSGYKYWKGIWTSINYLRNWLLSTSDNQSDIAEIRKAFSFIVDSQEKIQDDIRGCLADLRKLNDQLAGLLPSSVTEREDILKVKEAKLRQWEEDLQKREQELYERQNSMTELRNEVSSQKYNRRDPAGLDIIRSNLSEEEIKWLKNTTAMIHKKHNLETSNKLVYLLIVMRDLGYLQAGVYPTGFIRLLQKWEIIPGSTMTRSKTESVRVGIQKLKKELPDEGKIIFRSAEWTKPYMKPHKDVCEMLAKDFEEESRKHFGKSQKATMVTE